MAALAAHLTETKEACHAIQSLGSPGYGPGGGPGAGRDGCRLQQQQFQQFGRDRLRPRPPPTRAPPTRPPPSTPAASSPASSGAVAQITANWEKFFDSNTPLAQR